MHIDPHENATSKYPLSLMLSAVGEFNPSVSSLTGTVLSSLLSSLYNPEDVEK